MREKSLLHSDVKIQFDMNAHPVKHRVGILIHAFQFQSQLTEFGHNRIGGTADNSAMVDECDNRCRLVFYVVFL